MALSKLKKIDLRKAWKHEAADFTNWLADEENLQLLSDEIGIDISLIQTEASVGKFSVDILAEEENTGRKVVIENQLEPTNHDHLGKIITYASGFDAEIIIWIVKSVRDEHKQAVDWLNEHTDDKINIFAIRMELWQIDDSSYAPKFNIVSKPNDWAKAVKRSSAKSELSDRKLIQLEFWAQFAEYASENQNTLSIRKAHPKHWFDISIGSAKGHITMVIDINKQQLRCDIWIGDSMDLFEALYAERESIQAQLPSHQLEWLELPGKKASRIRTALDIDIGNTENWDRGIRWLTETAITFQSVFGPRIKSFK